MLGGNVNNPYPITLLVNYWELSPGQMGARLDALLKSGITHFATFVPWQVVESDISHSLTRFLQAISERMMKVSLILTPEVGVHLSHSGLPKDVMLRKDNMAQHCQQGRVTVNLPPNTFTLPSLFAQEFIKRYYGFLGRMDGLFADLARSQPNLLRGVSVVLTGSFWKYYRSPMMSSQAMFGGIAGDYSTHAGLAYRQRVEHFFSHREYTTPTAASANRWKTRSLEETNRRWFNQHSEDVFRSRSFQMIQKKSKDLAISEMELFTPEADPALAYSNFLRMVSGGHSDFSRLSNIIEEMASRISFGASAPTQAFINWTSMGGFRMLTESEKQFLMMKSLLLFGGQGGGLLIEDSDWFALSPGFRSRADVLAHALQQGEYQLKNRALYLVPHLWSDYGVLWSELSHRLGPAAKMVSSIDLVLREQTAQLLIVDPTQILTQELVQKITGWAKAGRVVVLPRSQLYTEQARITLEQVLSQTQKIEVDLGMSYRLHALGDGKVIIYDVPHSSTLKSEGLTLWQTFLTSVLSLADVESFCRISDGRLSLIPLERTRNELAIFILNSARRHVKADVIFPVEVQIRDLAVALDPTKNSADAEVVHANRFSLDVPQYGILPMAVDGLGLLESRERQLAASVAQATQENAMGAAVSELAGFEAGETFEDLWN